MRIGAATGGCSSRSRWCGGGASGRSTQNVEPLPSCEATETRPCIRRTSSREI